MTLIILLPLGHTSFALVVLAPDLLRAGMLSNTALLLAPLMLPLLTSLNRCALGNCLLAYATSGSSRNINTRQRTAIVKSSFPTWSAELSTLFDDATQSKTPLAFPIRPPCYLAPIHRLLSFDIRSVSAAAI
ncbi:hypothetical protein F5Y10DRAFT_27721 [Nemania abortiva]|nr:hypothetical protein F5Y10DRAFT_27721 [Nemania abortiva]